MSLAVIGLRAGVPLRLQAERVAVQDARLAGFRLDLLRDDVGNRPRALGGGQQQLAKLAHGQLVELLLVLEQRLGPLDDGRRADQGRQRLVGAGALAGVLRGHVGGRGPVDEPVLVDTGASSPVTVARKVSASFCAGALGALAGGCRRAGGSHRGQATEAGNQDAQPPNRSSHAAKPTSILRSCGRTGRVVTERPPCSGFVVLVIAVCSALAATLAAGCKQGTGERCEQNSDCAERAM